MSKINRFYVFLSSFCLSLIFILPFFYVKVDSVSADSNVNYYDFEGSNIDAPVTYYQNELVGNEGSYWGDMIDLRSKVSFSEPSSFIDKYYSGSLTLYDLLTYNFMVLFDSSDSSYTVFYNNRYLDVSSFPTSYGSSNNIPFNSFLSYDGFLDSRYIGSSYLNISGDFSSSNYISSHDLMYSSSLSFSDDTVFGGIGPDIVSAEVWFGKSVNILNYFSDFSYSFNSDYYHSSVFKFYDVYKDSAPSLLHSVELNSFRFLYNNLDRSFGPIVSNYNLAFGPLFNYSTSSHYLSWPSSFSSLKSSSSLTADDLSYYYWYYEHTGSSSYQYSKLFYNMGDITPYNINSSSSVRVDIYKTETSTNNGIASYKLTYDSSSNVWSGNLGSSQITATVAPSSYFFDYTSGEFLYPDFYSLRFSTTGGHADRIYSGVGLIRVYTVDSFGVSTLIWQWSVESEIETVRVLADSFGSFRTDLSTSYEPGVGRIFNVDMTYLDIPLDSSFSYNGPTNFSIVKSLDNTDFVFTNYVLTSHLNNLTLAIGIDGFTSDNIVPSSDSLYISSVVIGSSSSSSYFPSSLISNVLSSFENCDFFNYYSYVFNDGSRITFFIPYQHDKHLLDYRVYFLDSDLSSSDSYLSGYYSGYSDGKTDGLSTGFSNGYKSGYETGYFNGHVDGVTDSSDYSFNSLIGSVVDVPVKTFSSLFDVELFGFNLKNLFIGLFTACVFLVVIKLILRSR